MTIAWALLIIRVITGVTLIAHGTQKLFGWFGGPGYEKFSQGFGRQGYKPVQLWTSLAILGEIGGGLALAFGFLTPLGAAGALGAMVMAIKTHWSNGFFNMKGGFEYPLALLTMSIAVGLAGPGLYSLDHLFGIALPLALFIVLAVAALVVDVIGILITRPSATTAQPGKAHTA